MWCVSTIDAEYIQRMEDVLAIYQRPYDFREPVICFDEKSVQLFQDRYAPTNCRPGKVARRDHEYIRRGTANIFCAIEPKAGRHFLKVTQRRTAADFAEAIRDLAACYPKARRIHLVLDNLNTHSLSSLIARFGDTKARRLWRRFQLHYTPKHASWLNQAEIQISALARGGLRGRRFPSIRILAQNVSAWKKMANRAARHFTWGFSVADARKKFKYCK